MLSRTYSSFLGNVTSPSSGRESVESNFVLLNGEQRTPDAALVAGKTTFCNKHWLQNFSSEDFPSNSCLQPNHSISSMQS